MSEEPRWQYRMLFTIHDTRGLKLRANVAKIGEPNMNVSLFLGDDQVRKRWKDTQTKPEGTAAGCGILFRLRTKQAVEVHWQ